LPFKSEYLADVGITPTTYTTAVTATRQICAIYKARRGSITPQFGGQLWNGFFSPLASQFPALPSTQQQFDTFATTHMLSLAALLRRNNTRDDFGVAQKMFNLFLKDHWALNVFSSQSELLLHLPLDRRVLASEGPESPESLGWSLDEGKCESADASERVGWLFADTGHFSRLLGAGAYIGELCLSDRDGSDVMASDLD